MVNVGILYPGDMGSSFGRLLASCGHRVITTLAGRSPRTRRLCAAAGLEVLPTLADVVREADVCFSIVPPTAAADVASAWCELAHDLAPTSAIFVDANAIRPEAAARIAAEVQRAGRAFVDAAIHGVAARLAALGTLYVSGSRASDVARLAEGGMRVRVLGAEPGMASAFKMLLGGMSKGLIALFLEMAMLARRQDILPAMIECYTHFYPGVMDVVARILPTYPQHAGRRAHEMVELEHMLRDAGLEPVMIQATRRVLAGVGEAEFVEPRSGQWTVDDVVEQFYQQIAPAPDPQPEPA